MRAEMFDFVDDRDHVVCTVLYAPDESSAIAAYQKAALNNRKLRGLRLARREKACAIQESDRG
jgi:hypothetical protein